MKRMKVNSSGVPPVFPGFGYSMESTFILGGFSLECTY